MARYTLTISPDYVKDWTTEHAVREFLQNAIDQESLDSNNKMTLSYDDTSVTIANKTSKLDKSTLLLGGGTKDGTDTIGQFGEGYKVAMLVLLREGYYVEIRNYGLKELWIPKIVNSKIYDSKVLAIDTKKYDFEEGCYNSLEIIISGLPNAEELIKSTYLAFRDSEVLFKGCNCDVLDKSEAGNIYIGGLLVSNTNLVYGYNFNVGTLKIGRDRNIIGGWNLYYETAQSWITKSNSCSNEALALITEEAEDVKYQEYFTPNSTLAELIKGTYKNVVVASTNEEASVIKKINSIADIQIVPNVVGKVMSKYYEDNDIIKVKQDSIKDQLQVVLDTLYEGVNNDTMMGFSEVLDTFQDLIDKVRN